jgi:uncharacterized protein YqeY
MIRERLSADLDEAIAGDDPRRACIIRLVLATIKDRDVNAGSPETGGGVSDEEIREILGKMVRQREESARDYEEAGRLALAAQEREEIRLIRRYLPRPMSEAEMERAVECAIRDCNAKSIRDVGRIMAHLRANHGGRMDFAKAGAALKTALR